MVMMMSDFIDKKSLQIPPALAAIAAGRDFLLTDEFSTAISRAPQTVRKNFCQTGHCFGIRPLKIGNRLLWPVADLARLLAGESVGEVL